MKEILPEISVIVAVYNVEKYLEQCLDSICGQTLRNIEIICVDDGSTDHSPEILDNYARRDCRIRVIHQKNRFAGVARNRGMGIAQGKYLSFLDSDDYFEKDMLEVMLKEAEENSADIVICNGKAYSEEQGEHFFSGAELDTALLPAHKKVFSVDDVADHLFQISRNFAWNKLFRREFVEQKHIYFQDLHTMNDGFFVAIAMAEAERISYTSRHLVIYRRELQSSLTNTRDNSIDSLWRMFLAVRDALVERGLFEKVKKSFINRALTFSIGNLLSMKTVCGMEEVFWKLKREMFAAFQIVGKPKTYFYDEYSFLQYERIMRLEFKEYLFELRREAIERQNKRVLFFPIKKLPINSKVLIYGAGSVGQNLYRQFVETGCYEVVRWVDKSYARYQSRGLPVCGTEQIKNTIFDYIVIAVLKRETAKEIEDFLIKQGIPEEKIIWENFG